MGTQKGSHGEAPIFHVRKTMALGRRRRGLFWDPFLEHVLESYFGPLFESLDG